MDQFLCLKKLDLKNTDQFLCLEKKRILLAITDFET